MAALPPAAAAAAPAAAAPLVALEVCNIPPETTHSELAAIFSQFCALEEVVTVFKHSSSGGGGDSSGGGCALVLLPASDAGACDSAEMAADILNDYPLEGSLLGVQLCDSPAEWLRRSLSPQLLDGLAQLLAPPQPAQPPPQPQLQPQQQQRQQPDGAGPSTERPWSGARGEASGGYPPSDAGDSSGGSSSPRSSGGGGGGSGGAYEPAGAAGGQVSEVVVMNLDPHLSAREIGEFFLQFGEVEKCRKPQGKRYAFVHYVDAACAARAREALHGTWVPELNGLGPVQVQPRMQRGQDSSWRADSRQRAEQQGDVSGRQLFVHNLGLEVGRTAVGTHFEQFGAIESVRKLPLWQYAFVTYARPEDAAAAIERADGVPVPELNPLLGAPIRAAAAALDGHQMGGSSLSVQVCSSPAAWVQRALGPQLLIGGSLGPSGAAQQAQQAAGERGSGSGTCGDGGGGGDTRPKLQRTLEEEPSDFGDEFLEEQPSSGSFESLPADFRLLAAISGSPGHGSGLRPMPGGSGSGSLSPHGPHLRRRGGSTTSLAGSVGSDGSAGECTIVVHNLAAYLSAREIGEFFMQFGEVGECHKPQGAAFAFVHYMDGAAAARAKEAVHYKLVPQLNPKEALSIQFCKHVPSSRSSAGRAATTERGSSDGGSREGSIADGGGQALAVNNIDPGVQYKEVRAFFSQFGKVQNCYRQPQTRFAFVTFAAPEAAVAALQAVDGTLCPELNPHGLVSAEYRRGQD
ncbi:mRNA export shuttling [Chlorella sorokiniana]|uniref:mRNA export shuttling n=1 Tax=Chlorella sorokiniana TaxID=3076 RepID=A0A2P6TM97_CHLSO|nr:mRNA export shuttling [Chlorella sorokiniana]|eukprot:PRW45456.1 mRNA export shuttling [Chlorella sorokiniana]